MTAPKRRWFLWSLVVVAFAASFGGGWIAGRVHLRHEQEEMWLREAEQEDDPFAEAHKPPAKDLSKDYLKVPEAMDYQGQTRLPSTEPSGLWNP